MQRQDEFAAFVDAHGARLLRVAYLLTGTQTDAQDLLQDALLQIYQRWDKVRGADHRAAYARKILVNEHLGQARKKALRLVPTGDLDAGGTVGAVDPGIAIARAAELQQALRDLPLRQRTAVVLRYYEGLDDTSIADVMGVGASTVRSTIARALSSLRRHIVHDGTGEERTSHEAV